MSLQTVTRPHFSLCGINMSCMALKGGAGGALFTVLYWIDSQFFILSVFRVFVYKCIFCVYVVNRCRLMSYDLKLLLNCNRSVCFLAYLTF